MDDELVDVVAPLLNWVELAGGETLFREGEAENGVYFVISGRLRASVAADGVVRTLNEVGRGETVGEMAVLTGEPRSATVTAIRDTVLAHADREMFQSLCLREPELSLAMAKVIINRLKRTGTREKVNRPATICLVAVTDGIDVGEFARRLGNSLDRWGVATVESSAHIDAQFGAGVAQCTPGDLESHERLALWLDDLEFWNEFVVLVTDDGETEWTRRCLRHADQILLLARADAPPRIHEIESRLCSGNAPITSARQMLVLIHGAETSRPKGTPVWAERRPVDAIVHVRQDSARDAQRLARIVSGNAIGLVLSGGGARGFAHLGVYKALEEAGIEIDLIAGTSIGAGMGAAMSLDLRSEALIDLMRRTFARSPLRDYNLLPLISVFRGKKLSDAIEFFVNESVGLDADVTDSWRTLRCIATNYSQAGEKVIARGPLAKAVLASTSIPMAVPPVPWDGDLLVDGCVLNNFPTSVMMEMNARRIIGVDLSSRRARAYEHDRIPGPFELLRDNMRGRRRKYHVPTLGTVIMTTNLLYSESRREQARRSVDIYINPPLGGIGVLDWKMFNRITEIGYESAKQVLAAMTEEELSAYRND